MTLLDTFIMSFGTEGLGEVAADIKNTEQKVKSLEKEEAKLNETVKKGGEEADKAKERLQQINKELPETKKHLNNLKSSASGVLLQLKNVAAAAAKIGISFIAVKKAIDFSTDFASQALEIEKAAKSAKKSIEDFQKEKFGRTIFTRQDINNAKDYEMVMRDIRAGTMQIGSNLARLLLPALLKLTQVVSKVINWISQHGTLVQIIAVIAAISGGIFGVVKVIKFALNPAIIKMGVSLWGALAPILPILLAVGAAIALIVLIIEDLIVWLNGGESAFGDLWDEIFGGAEEAKKMFNELSQAVKELWEIAGPILKAIGQFLLKYIYFSIRKCVESLKDLIVGFKSLMSGDIMGGLKSIGKGVAKAATAPTGATIDTVKTYTDGSHAEGLDYVPFDGYIAELHKGERVQTAQEADTFRKGNWKDGLIAAKKAVNFTANYPLNAIPQSAISNAVAYNYNSAYNKSQNSALSSRSINISGITINTQATNAQGIAQDFAMYVKQAMMNLDDGMLA